MVNRLLNSRLGTTFTTDPAVAIWTYIKAQWTVDNEYSPPAVATVKFDTKFGSMKGFFNFVIIENMPSAIKHTVVGGSRTQTEDVKRLQILCLGGSAKNNKWNMERHINAIVNGNPTGMWATYGIDEMKISSFQDIPTDETDSTITNLNPTKGFHKARSFAIVTLKYDEEIEAVV